MTPAPAAAPTGAAPRWSVLSWLAPAALGLLPAVLLAFATAEKTEAYDWRQHRLAGAGFALAFASTLLLGPWRRNLATVLAGSIAAGAIVFLTWRSGLPDFTPLLAVAALLVAGGYWLTRRDAASVWSETALVGLGSLVSFWAVSRLSWWLPLPEILRSWPNQALFLGTTAGLVWTVRSLVAGPGPGAPRWSTPLIDVAVLAVLAAAVLRTNTTEGNWLFPHHWGVYVTAADQVRAGGILLGNVASQYGFLNTLLLALLPTDDRFTALYWLNGVLVWISGAVIYFILRSWLVRWWWQLGAGLVTVCTVAFLCGDAPVLTGPLPCPSIAAVRFIWVYALIGYLVWWHARAVARVGSIRPVLWTGSTLWLLGVLWSVESAVYVTATWFPAAAILAMPPAGETRSPLTRIKDLFAGIARALIIPALLLLVALAALAGYYRLFLGRLPVWSHYWEYATAFSSGFGALPIEPLGGVWTLLLLHAALLSTLVGLDTGPRRASLALAWAAWGAFWVISTYYIARSHGNNITNLSPVLLLVTGAMVHAWGTGERRGPAGLWIWLTIPTFVGALLWLVLTNIPVLTSQWETYAVQPRAARLLPGPPPALTGLLESCQRTQAAPWSVLDHYSYQLDKMVPETRPGGWLPLGSLPLYMPLPEQRRLFFLDAHSPATTGWLLFPSGAMSSGEHAWLFNHLLTKYSCQLVLEQEDWRAWLLVPLERPAPPAP